MAPPMSPRAPMPYFLSSAPRWGFACHLEAHRVSGYRTDHLLEGSLLFASTLLLYYLHWSHASDMARLPVLAAILILAQQSLVSSTYRLLNSMHPRTGTIIQEMLDNSIEIITMAMTLVKRSEVMTQSLVVGSLLSRILLVIGTYIVVGGINFVGDGMIDNSASPRQICTLLSILPLTLPAILHIACLAASSQGSLESVALDTPIGSYVMAVVCPLVYCFLKVFIRLGERSPVFSHPIGLDHPVKGWRCLDSAGTPGATLVFTSPPKPSRNKGFGPSSGQVDADHRGGLISFVTALLGLLMIGFTVNPLIESAAGLGQSWSLGDRWIGLVLVPVPSSAYKHITMMLHSTQAGLELGMDLTLRSTSQLALLIFPSIVLLGPLVNRQLGLLFDQFHAVALVSSVVLSIICLSGPKKHWVDGLMLQGVYALIALLCFFE